MSRISGVGMAKDRTGLDRVDGNIAWYSRKSSQSQALYKSLKLSQIVIAAVIPVVSALTLASEDSAGPIATGILGMLIVITEGIQSTFQPLEKWLLYRSTAEALKRERNLFFDLAGPYEGLTEPAARKLFVAKIEDLMTAENQRWQATSRSNPEPAGA